MTPDFEDVPVFEGQAFYRLPEGRFEEAVRMVIRETGFDDERAMRVVDAVFGPLKLLSPPAAGPWINCPYVFFPVEGGWQYCRKDHGDPDDDPEFHSNEAEDDTYEDWDQSIDIGRVFKIKIWGED